MSSEKALSSLLLRFPNLVKTLFELTNENQALIGLILQIRKLLEKPHSDLRQFVSLNNPLREKLGYTQQAYEQHLAPVHKLVAELDRLLEQLEASEHDAQSHNNTMSSHAHGLQKELEQFQQLLDKPTNPSSPHSNYHIRHQLVFDAIGFATTQLHKLARRITRLDEEIRDTLKQLPEPLSNAVRPILESLHAGFKQILHENNQRRFELQQRLAEQAAYTNELAQALVHIFESSQTKQQSLQPKPGHIASANEADKLILQARDMLSERSGKEPSQTHTLDLIWVLLHSLEEDYFEKYISDEAHQTPSLRPIPVDDTDRR